MLKLRPPTLPARLNQPKTILTPHLPEGFNHPKTILIRLMHDTFNVVESEYYDTTGSSAKAVSGINKS